MSGRDHRWLAQWPHQLTSAPSTPLHHSQAPKPTLRTMDMCGAKDRSVMAMVAGWAVFSLRAAATKQGSRMEHLVPLLDAMIVKGGPAAMCQKDPAVLYMLARQQFGGLTAVTPAALDAFCLAQALVSAHLSMEHSTLALPLCPPDPCSSRQLCSPLPSPFLPAQSPSLCPVAYHGAKTFQMGVDAVLGSAKVTAAFIALLPTDVMTNHLHQLLKKLLDKIFNQAAAEFCVQIAAIWGEGGSKQGVGIKQELKVLQKQTAKAIKEDNPVTLVPEDVLKLTKEEMHITMCFVCKFHPKALAKKAVTMSSLKKLLVAYKDDPVEVKKCQTKALLQARLVEVVLASSMLSQCELDPVAASHVGEDVDREGDVDGDTEEDEQDGEEQEDDNDDDTM